MRRKENRRSGFVDYRIVYVGAQTVIGTLFLVHFIMHRIANRGKRIDKLDILYLLFLGTTILDSIWMLIDGRVEYRTGHVVLEVVYLTMMSLTGYDWFLYTLELFPSRTDKISKYKYVLAIPAIIMIILIFCSLKTGWIFEVDATGKYIRGDLNMFPVVTNYAYMLLGSFIAIQCMKEAMLTIDKRRFLLAALFPVPILIFSAVQMMLPPGLPLMQGGVLVAVLMQYGTTQSALITGDYLTSLPNRVAFEQDLIERIRRYDPGSREKLYLIEGDLDDFKGVNDTYGHSVGDKALIRTSDVLCQVLSPYEPAVFRYAGDEFMMLIESKEEPDVAKIEDEMNEKLVLTLPDKEIKMSISLGLEKYDGNMDMRSFIDAADEKLYERKEQKPDRRKSK